MRAQQAVLKMCGVSLALALIVANCAHAAIVGSQPNTRRLVLNGREVDVETGIDDANESWMNSGREECLSRRCGACPVT
jgi:hypothetical protein